MFKNLMKGVLSAITGPRVVDVETAAQTFSEGGPITAVCFSPNSARLASGCVDGTVRIRDLEAKTEETLSLPGPIRAVSFSPDGGSLLVGCETGEIKVWSFAKGEFTNWTVSVGKELKTIPVRAAACHPDGTLFASASPENVSLSTFPEGRPVGNLVGQSGIPLALSFSRTGEFLAVGALEEVSVWETGTRTRLWCSEFSEQLFGAVAFHPDGSVLAAGTNVGLIVLFDREGEDQARMRVDRFQRGKIWWENACNSLVFTPDGRFLISGQSDGQVRVWDLKSHKNIQTLKEHSGSVLAVDVSPDGRLLAGGGRAGELVVWSLSRPAE
ncbi:MAG: WD40 repeat domain-containing protein [Bacillota bacterium]